MNVEAAYRDGSGIVVKSYMLAMMYSAKWTCFVSIHTRVDRHLHDSKIVQCAINVTQLQSSCPLSFDIFLAFQDCHHSSIGDAPVLRPANLPHIQQQCDA
jgi:hypothetical protein